MALTLVKEGREALVAATLRVVDRSGIDRLTLRAVGKEAAVSAPAVYWHFAGKAELLDVAVAEAAESFVREVRAAVARAPRARRLDAAGQAFARFVIDHPRRFQLLFRRPLTRAAKPLHTPAAPDSTFRVLVELVRESMAAGLLERGHPVAVALAFAGLAQGLALLYERGRFATKAEFAGFARTAFRRLLRGYAP